MENLKKFTKKHTNLLVFLVLIAVVFCIFYKSLFLTLYGDDWLVISKHLGGYGVGKEKSYWHPDMWFSNYAFQKLIAYVYVIFGFRFLPYFIINLSLRAFTAYCVFIIAKTVLKKSQAFTAALFFAITVVGSETTDWVYNMNSYLGIGIALLGISLLINNKPESLNGWLSLLIGYIVVPIRLYILTTLMPIFYLFRTVTDRKQISAGLLIRGLVNSVLAFLPFLILRLLFPFLGWQKVNSEMLGVGFNTASRMISVQRFDFILTPFTNIGKMIFPWGVSYLQEQGFRVYPLATFLFYGFFIWLIGALIYFIFYENKNIKSVIKSLFVALIPLSFLKFFVRYQGQWLLKEFSYFVWTYIGMIIVIALVRKIFYLLKNGKRKNLLYYLVASVFLGSFIYPWFNQPGHIFTPEDRYLVLPGVGLALIIGSVMDISGVIYVVKFIFKKHSLNDYFKLLLNKYSVFLLTILIFFQVISVQVYFTKKLQGRNYYLYNLIFSKIQKDIPELDVTSPSLFYFTGFDPEVYESLLRFGFGYHMQLLYNFPFNEPLHPMSSDSKEEIIRHIQEYKVKESNFYMYEWRGENVINKSGYAREIFYKDEKNN